MNRNTFQSKNSCDLSIKEYWTKFGDVRVALQYVQDKTTNASDLLALIASQKSKDVIQSQLQNIQEKHIHRTKSLTVWQLEKLSQILREGIAKDDRYCALTIMLYTGARPAEVRALRWGDLVPFLDHPDHLLIKLHRTLNVKGRPKNTMKTRNAYRSISIHFELFQLLNIRYQVISTQMDGAAFSLVNRPLGKEITDLPICCFGNIFDRYCRDYEVALLAEQVFSQQLRLPQRDIYIYLLDSLIEQGNSGKGISSRISKQDQRLTLYVLRRNFWTWLESSTRLTDFRKKIYYGTRNGPQWTKPTSKV